MSTHLARESGSFLRRLAMAGLVAAASSAFGCGDPTFDATPVTTVSAEIQAGQIETGYPGVGYIGPTECTGSLISQEWVLTAKHCAAANMTFVVGNTAAGGVSHPIDLQVAHPLADLMLVHLTNPVEGIPILKVNEGALPAINTVCTAVGFGDHFENGATTSGTKRSATSRVTSADSTTIVVQMVSGIADSGDSGGPLLCNGTIAGVTWMHIDGDWPSHVSEIYTTVDSTWIATTIAPTYVEMTLQNGWTNAAFSTRPASAALVSGKVHFKGAITTTGTSMTAFTLPSNMRPSTNAQVPVDLFGGAKGRLNITPSGAVSVQAQTAASDAKQFTSLEGASFAVTTNGFTQFILRNGWTAAPFSTGTPGILDIGGVMHFKGALSTTGTNMVFTILPINMGPAADAYVPVDLLNGRKGTIRIRPNGEVSVQSAGALSDAQAFTSLEGASYARVTTAFTPLSLVNGWTNAPSSTATAGVEKVSGIVHFKGAIATTGTNAAPFTLPAGFRPPVAVYLSVDLCNAAKGRLLITTTGQVTVSVAPGGSWSNAQCRTSLEGASFTVSDFTPLSLEAGWIHGPWATGRAGVAISSGIVQLAGAIGTSGTVATPFTLPPPFRPSHPVYLPVNLCDAAKGRLVIEPSGVATVVSADGNFGTAGCFTSLEGVSFPVSTSGFTPLALDNGWGNGPLGTRPPSVANVGGIVRLAGAMKTTGTNMTAFTLPSSVRPSTNVYVPVDIFGSKKGRFEIAPTGVVTVRAEVSDADARQFTSLEGVWFTLSTGGFNLPPLVNGWSNAPFGTRSAAASSSRGIVRLAGAISTGGTNPVPFTLPVGFRPAATSFVSVDLCNAAQGRLAIDTAGAVSIQPFGGVFGPAACFTSLEGVSFRQ